jgi:hypothetical protein
MTLPGLLIALLLSLGVCQAAYHLPGVAPSTFAEGETVSFRSFGRCHHFPLLNVPVRFPGGVKSKQGYLYEDSPSV